MDQNNNQISKSILFIFKVTKKAASVLLGGEITDFDVARSKVQLKTDIAYATESDGGYMDEVGLQTLLTGSASTLSDMNTMIDSITASDMKSFINKGKLTMASFGKIGNVPHLDQLKK
jgi:predicted Zn-dependent peptidase